MKLYFIAIYARNGDDAVLVKSASDLSSFGYFQRRSVEDFLKFTSKTIVTRLDVGCRTSVKENPYVGHAYMRNDSTCVVVVTDFEYPDKAAHTIILKVLDEHPHCNLDACLRKFQDPKEADSMMRLQSELEDTKAILKTTIENLLKRGEKLDDLVAKSDDLSAQSKLFYKTARKTNRCCTIL